MSPNLPASLPSSLPPSHPTYPGSQARPRSPHAPAGTTRRQKVFAVAGCYTIVCGWRESQKVERDVSAIDFQYYGGVFPCPCFPCTSAICSLLKNYQIRHPYTTTYPFCCPLPPPPPPPGALSSPFPLTVVREKVPPPPAPPSLSLPASGTDAPAKFSPPGGMVSFYQ